MTQEFHISVTPVGQNDYLVRTEQVAPGVPLAEELVSWPVADWLMAAGHLMNDPLKSVLEGDIFASGGNESDIARNSVNLVALGQQFYNALFQGTLRDSWITAQGIAQNHQQVLRLRLGLKDTRLARLPWEVMHAGDRPLATGPYVAFSRFQSGILGASPLRSLRGATPTPNMPTPREEGGVKVLMVIASPSDQVRLDLLKQEAIKLQAELHRVPRLAEGSNRFPEIELTVLDQPGREELTQALEQGRFHVLHYSGHSNFGSNGGEIYLASRRTGLTEILTGDDLAGLLVNNNIQMAVFNSCLGAYTAASDASGDTGERNLAESLVKRGIRSVLAMSERIPDEVALTLTQLFYRNLSQGYPVDLCVSRVRQGLISAYGSHQMYWALPILYLQPEFDGFLSQETEVSESAESRNQYSSPLGSTSTMYSAMADDSEIPLGMEEMNPSGLARDFSGLDWLGEDTWGDLVDEIEYDDPSYEEDSAIVSDLFRQLDNQKAPTELDQQIHENSLQQRQVSEEITSLQKEVDLWGEAPAPPPQAAGNLEGNWQNSADFLRRRSPTQASQPAPPRNRTRRRKLWPIVGIVGISALAAAIALNWWQNRPQAMPNIPVIPTQSLPIQKQQNIDLQTAPTGIVAATATEKLSQGDLQGGLLTVEELLNRGALAAADTALKLIPNKQADDASVNFYKGRLAWQSIQTGDNNYSVDDARRYWETATKAKPESLLYNNALGFAYYTEGNLNRANDSWFKALNLALKEQNKNSKTAVPEDALTSYAGLALGLYKSALSQPNGKQTQYLNEAIKLRQTVIESDPVNFQVDKLAKNWLWTEKAIADWRSLLQEKGQEQ
ncbi:cell division protein HetF [Nostoc sp.]|uniref:cell division protein HetF n=1 Tax=Nostoc sp. TaxID=1180 RepID=UPI002FF93BC6